MDKQWVAAAIVAATISVGAPAAAQTIGAVGATDIAEAGPPVAPDGMAASFAPPSQDADGYLTPNRGLAAAETAWHLRVALNIAALGCRGTGEAATVAGYNALLATEKAALAAASDGTAAAYRLRYGTAAWQSRFDDDMTRLYNFWAQPAAHAAFCREADAVLRDAAVVEPSDFGQFAAAALPRLERPFLTFFAAVDRYRADLAAWRAVHAPQVALAALPPSMPGQPPR